jgi:hypothetical protein
MVHEYRQVHCSWLYSTMGQQEKGLSEIADYTSGMTHIYIECALMAY